MYREWAQKTRKSHAQKVFTENKSSNVTEIHCIIFLAILMQHTQRGMAVCIRNYSVEIFIQLHSKVTYNAFTLATSEPCQTGLTPVSKADISRITGTNLPSTSCSIDISF